MRRLVFVAMLLPVALPSSASTRPSWNGPSCQDGAAQWEQCSKDPTTPDDMPPCYESHFPDYIPNRIELDFIAVCQAAKGALGAPTDEMADKVQVLEGRVDEMTADVGQYPDQAADYQDEGETVGRDMENLGSALTAYSGDESDDNQSDVQEDLQSIAMDSQVLGGGH